MYLRKLKTEDAPLMIEWMHDDNVVHDLHTDFASRTISNVNEFIKISNDVTDNLHLAIASNTDEYVGTVSLKHIDNTAKNAEFAITVRKLAMGKGYSWFAMAEIIRKAFEELELECLYWCVSEHNLRAVRFYNKHGFTETNAIPTEILDRYKDVKALKWYMVTKEPQ